MTLKNQIERQKSTQVTHPVSFIFCQIHDSGKYFRTLIIGTFADVRSTFELISSDSLSKPISSL